MITNYINYHSAVSILPDAVWRSARGRSRNYPFAQCLIERDIVSRHPLCRKSLLESRANLAPVDFLQAMDRLHGFVFSVDDESGHTIVDHLRHRAGAECNDRCPAG